MATYAAILRTHVWDEGVANMAHKAAKCCASGYFVVATDNSNRELSVTEFPTLPHTSDFSDLGLPCTPDGKTLWWNADYVLYSAKRSLPTFDYYIMFEYDVFVDCNLDEVINDCAREKIDFVAHDIKKIEANHWSRPTARDMGDDIYWAFLPLIILSSRAVDLLFQKRVEMAEKLRLKLVTEWPYCEPFIPTALSAYPNIKMKNLGAFANVDLFRYRPFLSTKDRRLTAGGLLAHPVLSGRRFVDATLHSYPSGMHLTPSGQLLPELATESAADILAATGDNGMNVSSVSTLEGNATTMFDVARYKPAMQSSHSRWSHAATAEADARRAVSGILPIDYAFHTDDEAEPWWKVDLLDDHIIAKIEILNRGTPALQSRFRHFEIDSSLDGEAWSTALSKTDDIPVSSDPELPAVFIMPVLFRARHVRIRQLDSGPMHLRRVRIFGIPVSGAYLEKALDTTAESLAQTLASPEGKLLFVEAVKSSLDRDIFKLNYDSYHLESLAPLAAGIDACCYVATQMPGARKLSSALALLDYAAKQASEIGMVLEFGVYSGRSINHIASLLPNRTISGFDSFEGLPENWRPGFARGAFATQTPKVRDNVKLYVGWFDHTLPVFIESCLDAQVALLHVDCDLYSSTKTIFSLLGGRIGPGTIIVFDEYFNYPEWRNHEYKAFQEFVAARSVDYEYIGYVPSHQQVAVRVISVG